VFGLILVNNLELGALALVWVVATCAIACDNCPKKAELSWAVSRGAGMWQSGYRSLLPPEGSQVQAGWRQRGDRRVDSARHNGLA
jgi:hypothetical protein